MSSVIPVKLKTKRRDKDGNLYFYLWPAELHTEASAVRVPTPSGKPIKLPLEDTEMDLTEDYIMVMPSGVQVPMWQDNTDDLYYVASDGIRSDS